MEGNKLLTLLVTVTVVIIFTGALLGPVINDYSETDRKFTNTGMFFMTDDDDYTLVYDPTGKFIINGEDLPFSDIPTGERVTIVSTEEFLLRFSVDASVHYSVTVISTTPQEICKDTDLVNTTFTFADGTLTITKEGSNDRTYTYTPESFRGIATKGNYVMTAASTPAKVNSDTTIIVGNGTTDVAHWYDRFYIEGTVEDMTVTPNTGITISDLVVNTTSVSGYVDLVELNSIQFTATDETHTVNATYNRVIVPTEITAELSQHLDAGEIAILAAIPLMAIAALVLLVVRYFVAGRD